MTERTSSSQTVRTRFAPSPTGLLHVGGLRTALYNWLFARQHGGTFILRLEDTDRERFVPESVDQILESLRWCGLMHDEGPDVGGPFGPYVQSERLPLYKERAEELLSRGHAYLCFCSEDRLEELRALQKAKKLPPQYDRHCRSIPQPEAEKRRSAGEPSVLRLKLPETGTVVVHDLIRGKVPFAYATLDDSVLLKSDGYPTYHLAVVVDDHLMNVTHVLRAEEWLPSAPKHLFLYQAFGWEVPQFAHLPVLLSPSGGKLSKRDGAVSVLEFRDQGYLPEALVNFLALLGWNPGDNRELFALDELVKVFSLERVQKAGAVFDTKKLLHLNGKYLRKLTPEDLLARAGESAAPLIDALGSRAARGVALAQDRLATLNELSEATAFLVELPPYEAELLISNGGTAGDTITILQTLAQSASEMPSDSIDSAAFRGQVDEILKRRGWSNAQALWPLRVALSGQKNSPGVFEIAEALGRDNIVRRIKTATEKLAALRQ